MKPIKMKGWSVMAGRDEIADLSVCVGADTALYSLWKPSVKERLRVLIGAPIAVGVLSQRQPPITVVVGMESIPMREDLS